MSYMLFDLSGLGILLHCTDCMIFVLSGLDILLRYKLHMIQSYLRIH